MPATTRTRGARKAIVATAAPAGLVPKVAKPRSKPPPKAQVSLSIDSSEDASRKRRKVEVKTESIPRPPIDYTGRHYQPSMLPVEPQFDVPEAMSHLIRFDPRFKGLFEAMKCRPFVEPFEALDPYRTLTTSIVGQQASQTDRCDD
jgi:DNA-3-methyladenine glycosylase II